MLLRGAPALGPCVFLSLLASWTKTARSPRQGVAALAVLEKVEREIRNCRRFWTLVFTKCAAVMAFFGRLRWPNANLSHAGGNLVCLVAFSHPSRAAVEEFPEIAKSLAQSKLL